MTMVLEKFAYFEEEIRECTRGRLDKYGYDLLLIALGILKLTEPYKPKDYLVLDFSDNKRLNVWLKNGEKRKVWGPRHYGHKNTKILLCSLYVAAKNEYFKKFVNRYDFSSEIEDEFRANIDRSLVNRFFKEGLGNGVFKVEDTAVKVEYIPKEIVGIETVEKINSVLKIS